MIRGYCYSCELVEAEWYIHVPIKNVITPIQCQAIAWANADLLWIFFSIKHAFENAVCKNGGHFIWSMC